MLELLQKSFNLGNSDNYGDALYHYENISDSNISEKFSNYKLLLEKSVCSKTYFTFKSNSVIQLLSVEVSDVISTLSFNDVRQEYRNISNAIKSESYNSESLLSFIRCSLYSPFQLDLLLAVSWFLKQNDFFENCNALSQNFYSMSALLRTVYDKSFRSFSYGTFLKIYEGMFDVRQFFKDLESLDIDSLLESTEIDFLYNVPIANYTYNQISTGEVGTSLSLGTIFLNEQKYINLNLEQHYQLCDEWTLVEGACQGYPPRKVSKNGFSLDKSQILVRIFPDKYKKIKYVRHGWTKAEGEDAKSELRNQYINISNATVLLVLDADEFYFPDDIYAVLRKFDDPNVSSVTLPQVHFWKDLSKFITGEYYDISHTRFFRLIPGSVYKQNHNFPEVNGVLLNKINNLKVKRTIINSNSFSDSYEYSDYCCFHLGFAKDFDDMRDKSDYYINRGEASTRKSTTESRAAWFGDDLPDKCKVRVWGGDIPSCLLEVNGENK